MLENKPRIGVLIYTYNRIDDARINMEIIRNVWSKSELLKNIVMVHSFNGQKDWWPEKYLEDDLLYLENPGHFAGAEILLNEGVKTFQEKYPDVDYVIILASDTWLVIPEYVEKIILSMTKEEKYLATCVWGTKKQNDFWRKGMAMDFSIFNLKWATKSKLFPIGFTEFRDKYEDLFLYRNETIYLEIVFALRFMQAIKRSIVLSSDNLLKPITLSYIYRMAEREPVHVNYQENIFFKKRGYHRTMYWPKMGLITHHDPEPKQKVLRKWHLTLGQYGHQFIDAEDLSYFNNGTKTMSYIKGNTRISYEKS